MWIFYGIISALFLGVYDISKKAALNRNAVMPVLLISTLFGALPWIPLVLISRFQPEWLAATPFFSPPMSPLEHGLIFIKSLIVSLSWVFVYFGMKHLPISIAAPIRASAPLWTLMGAVTLMGEMPSLPQWAGLALTLGGYFILSLAGQREGIVFHRNRWVGAMAVGTLLGAVSALYDKFLLHRYPTGMVQPWFSFYLVVILLPVVLLAWWPNRRNTTPFVWRPTLPLIGLSLGIADFLYFQALRDPEALISILSAVRRSNVLISFGVGGLLFREQNRARKAVGLAIILAGVLIIVFAV
jgi:transporter family protein